MIISMGLTMAIQNSRTLAQKFATKNPHGKTETGATAYSESQNVVQKIGSTAVIRIIEFCNSMWTY